MSNNIEYQTEMKSKGKVTQKVEHDGLVGVVGLLFRWRQQIIRAVLASLVVSVLVSLLVPVYYRSIGTFYAASTDLASPERIFGEISSDAMEFYGESSDVDRVITVARSNELADFMIDSFRLFERYDIDPEGSKAQYKVRLEFADLYNIKQTKYDALELSIEDKDKEVAALMANTAIRKIDEILRSLIKSSQEQVINTYKKSISEGELSLKMLNDTLAKARERFQIFNIKTQSESISKNLSNAQSQVLVNKIELEEFEKSGRVHRDTIIKRRATIAGLEEKVKNLQSRLNLFSKGVGNVSYLEQIKKESEASLGDDKERYNKLLAAFESYFPTIHIVEKAQIPVVKSRPIRWLIVLGSVLLTFVVSVLTVLLLNFYKDVDWKKELYG